jgi:flagellar L-ring protein precursor FlgH
MKKLKSCAILAPLTAALMLSACSGPMPMTYSSQFAPVLPIPRESVKQNTGAIFAADSTDMWQAKRRDYRVGDIITVLLNESTQAARTLNNETSREATTDVVPNGLTNRLSGLNSVLGGLKTDGGKTTNVGKGTADQQASLTGSIAATVVEVQANGNLVIRGEKQLSMSEGGEVIQVSGVIRPDDVSAISTVQSRRLANAQIAYRAAGDLANATRAGWGTSAIWKYWPF